MKSKFRVWDSINNRWVSSMKYFFIADNGEIYIETENSTGEESFVIKKLTNLKYHKISMYTGLTDTNKNAIYEGDVVKQHYFHAGYDSKTLGMYERDENIIGKVAIDELGTYTETSNDIYYWAFYVEEPWEQIEVIGNIYEHPELLEYFQNKGN